ncbi:MAG: hypothetical protein L6277_09435 [Desulfobacterales bacterium]|nr:hypothetical protein [Desulfobacterales bacterium]
MWMRKFTSWGLVVALCLVGQGGCAPRLAPATPAGVALEPGRYLTAYYRAPDFTPAQATYVLTPFEVSTAQGVAADTFQALFLEELTQAWRANGLKLSDQGDTVVDGVVQFVAVRGAAFRFLRGRIDTDLVVSGAITRGGDTLFACQDRITMSSPVNPGPPAPKEDELLLRQAARTFAIHLLNEMLLYWPPVEGK